MASQFFRKRPTAMTRAEFMKRFGGVYEHSPWIAEAVYNARLSPAHDGVQALHTAMVEVVEEAPRETKLALIRAHPDLGARLAIKNDFTAASTREQREAGLNSCTPEEFDRLHALNAEYKRKFGFPFIMAVRGKERSDVFSAFEQRINNDAETEFRTALAEVHKIALLRLSDL